MTQPSSDPKHSDLLRELEEFAATASSAEALMEHVSQRLHESMARYNWVGFYLVDPHDSNILVIGPYVGSFTPNARIPLDQGLCGAAARTGRTVVVEDVRKDSRYLAGSSLVHSEVVVPIFVKGALAGELDVESYFPNTFTSVEKDFVESCAEIVREFMGKRQLK